MTNMLNLYEYIFPDTSNQITFRPVNDISGLISVLKNGSEAVTYTVIDRLGPDGVTVIGKDIQLDTGIGMADYLMIQLPGEVLLGGPGDVIHKKYGASQRLMNNHFYEADFKVAGTPIQFKFTSRFDPLYCSAKMIREDLDSVVTLSDDQINFIIWDKSYEVMMFMSGAGDLNYTMPVPYQLKDPAKIPYNIQQHVRYKAEYEILMAVYLTLSGKAGRVSKKLGDLQIEKEITIPFINDFLRAVKEKLDKYPLTGKSIARSVVKGEANEPWPVTSPRRSF